MTQPAWGLRYASHMGFRSPDAPLFRHMVGTLDPAAHVRFAASLGLAGVQHPWALARPGVEIDAFRHAAEDCGIEGSCVVFAPFAEFRQPLWGLPPGLARATIERRIRDACEVARKIRSVTVAIVATASDEPHAAQLDNMRENLLRAADLADEFAVTLVVETMRTVPNMLLTSYGELHHIVQRVDHPRVRMLFDTYHVRTLEGEDVVSRFIEWYEQIALIQLADHPDKVEPGAGTIDFVSLLAYAMRHSFSGLVELEHVWAQEGIAGETTGLERVRAVDAAAVRRAQELGDGKAVDH